MSFASIKKIGEFPIQLLNLLNRKGFNWSEPKDKDEAIIKVDYYERLCDILQNRYNTLNNIIRIKKDKLKGVKLTIEELENLKLEIAEMELYFLDTEKELLSKRFMVSHYKERIELQKQKQVQDTADVIKNFPHAIRVSYQMLALQANLIDSHDKLELVGILHMAEQDIKDDNQRNDCYKRLIAQYNKIAAAVLKDSQLQNKIEKEQPKEVDLSK